MTIGSNEGEEAAHKVESARRIGSSLGEAALG